MKDKPKYLVAVLMFSALLVLNAFCVAENIDPKNDDSQYSYGENVDWLNWEPNTGHGVQVDDTQLSGYIWAENIGWVNLRYQIGGAGPDTGVVNDGNGNLSGYAWGENVGWINFAPQYGGGVRIDKQGVIKGWAWGENIGWIHLHSGITLTIAKTAPNTMKLSWDSIKDALYDVYSSIDLLSWSKAASNVTGDTGTTEWIDSSATGNKKFYVVEQTTPESYRVKTSWRE